MSKAKRDAKLFLTDLLDAVGKIEAYIGDMDREEFLQDDKTQDAVLRNLEVIGEAAKNMPPETRERYPDIDWKGAAGMRDKLIHEYFGVSFRIVWESVKNDLPLLKTRIEEILEEHD